MALLTPPQVAKRMKVTPGRIRQLIAEGRIRATKFGPVNLIEESEIGKFEKKKRGRPKSIKS